jgi:hypothetical protein
MEQGARSGERETMDIEQLKMDNAQSRMKKDFDSLLPAPCSLLSPGVKSCL